MDSVKAAATVLAVSVLLGVGGCADDDGGGTAITGSASGEAVRATATAVPSPTTPPTPQSSTTPGSEGDSSPDSVTEATWVVGVPAAEVQATFEDPTQPGRFWRPWQGPANVGKGSKVLVLRSFDAAGERTDADLLVLVDSDRSGAVVDAMVLHHNSLGLVVGAACAGNFPMVLNDATVGRARAWRVAVDPLALMEVSVRSDTIHAECTEPRSAPAGVTDDDPALFTAEIDAMRASAGPGRIVGFVSLGGFGSFPLSPVQPVCVGVGDYRRVVPGALVSAVSANGEVLAVATLQGSAFDGPIGCSLWFGLDLPANTGQIRIDIAGHPLTQALDAAELDVAGWSVRVSPSQVDLSERCPGDAELCIPLEALN